MAGSHRGLEHSAVGSNRTIDNATAPAPLEHYLRRRASWHAAWRRPGPRRGHTAARAFEGGPIQLANHAISWTPSAAAPIGTGFRGFADASTGNQ